MSFLDAPSLPLRDNPLEIKIWHSTFCIKRCRQTFVSSKLENIKQRHQLHFCFCVATKNNILCWCSKVGVLYTYLYFGCNGWYVLILEVVIRNYKKIIFLRKIQNCTSRKTGEKILLLYANLEVVVFPSHFKFFP